MAKFTYNPNLIEVVVPQNIDVTFFPLNFELPKGFRGIARIDFSKKPENEFAQLKIYVSKNEVNKDIWVPKKGKKEADLRLRRNWIKLNTKKTTGKVNKWAGILESDIPLTDPPIAVG